MEYEKMQHVLNKLELASSSLNRCPILCYEDHSLDNPLPTFSWGKYKYVATNVREWPVLYITPFHTPSKHNTVIEYGDVFIGLRSSEVNRESVHCRITIQCLQATDGSYFDIVGYVGVDVVLPPGQIIKPFGPGVVLTLTLQVNRFAKIVISDIKSGTALDAIWARSDIKTRSILLSQTFWCPLEGCVIQYDLGKMSIVDATSTQIKGFAWSDKYTSKQQYRKNYALWKLRRYRLLVFHWACSPGGPLMRIAKTHYQEAQEDRNEHSVVEVKYKKGLVPL